MNDERQPLKRLSLFLWIHPFRILSELLSHPQNTYPAPFRQAFRILKKLFLLSSDTPFTFPKQLSHTAPASFQPAQRNPPASLKPLFRSAPAALLFCHPNLIAYLCPAESHLSTLLKRRMSRRKPQNGQRFGKQTKRSLIENKPQNEPSK